MGDIQTFAHERERKKDNILYWLIPEMAAKAEARNQEFHPVSHEAVGSKPLGHVLFLSWVH